MIPKLRAWDKVGKSISSVSEITYSGDLSYLSFVKLSGNNRLYGPESRLADDVIIMQSTGLKDKNGVEIFEGDIVNYVKSFTNPMTGSGSLSINKNLRIIFKDAEFTADGIDIRLKKIVSHMEVIGNIYENPELLEGAAR